MRAGDELYRQLARIGQALAGAPRLALLDLLAQGPRTVVIDVRPTEEYPAAHIAGAISLPLVDLKRRLATLPKSRDVVAYCRGPYCVMAPEAVEWLRARGFRARALGEGVAEWRALGLPVAEGAHPSASS